MAETPCYFNGNTAMYGLGIRIGYYLQWFSAIFADWKAPSEVNNLREANTLFTTATFLATVIQVSRNALEIVEVYIVLVLIVGLSMRVFLKLAWRIYESNSSQSQKSGTKALTKNFKLDIHVVFYGGCHISDTVLGVQDSTAGKTDGLRSIWVLVCKVQAERKLVYQAAYHFILPQSDKSDHIEGGWGTAEP